MTKITEIIPENMPEWFYKDLEDGQVFSRMVGRMQSKDKEIAELKAEIEAYENDPSLLA